MKVNISNPTEVIYLNLFAQITDQIFSSVILEIFLMKDNFSSSNAN